MVNADLVATAGQESIHARRGISGMQVRFLNRLRRSKTLDVVKLELEP